MIQVIQINQCTCPCNLFGSIWSMFLYTTNHYGVL